MSNILRATSSGVLTGNAQVSSLSGYLMGVDVQAPATGITTITIYDSNNSTTSGKLVLSEIVMDAGFMSLTHEYFAPVCSNNGLYVTLSGPTLRYIVRYSLGG